MSALAHDERDALERRARLIVVQIIADVQNSLRLVGKKIEVTYRDTGWSQAISSFAEDHALAASRQREEAAKGEIARLKAENTAWFHTKENLLRVRDALIAENDRLTLAASESARTLQVAIAAAGEVMEQQNGTIDALQAQVTALREALANQVKYAYDGEKYICLACGTDKHEPHSPLCRVGEAERLLAALPQP